MTASVVFGAGGLVGSLWVRSPAQLAAQQAPPAASVLTSPVVRRVLAQTVVIRGTVGAAAAITFTPTAEQGATTLVVSATPRQAGDTLKAGDVIVQVSGRPVIALPGAVPAYRDLKPGDTGMDVEELQTALKSLGYRDNDPAGRFGSATKQAVSALYSHLGYDVATTGGPNDVGDRAALTSANTAVTQAQRAVSTAEAALAAAQAAASGPGPTPSPPDAGASTVADAQRNLAYARQDLATAKQAQADLVATTGVELPLGEFLFIPSFPATLAAINGHVGSSVTQPLVTVNTGAIVVTSMLQQADSQIVKPGMKVSITAEALGEEVTGTVSSVGAYTAGQAAPSDGSSSGGTTGGNGTGGSGGGQGSGSNSGSAQPATGYPLTVTSDTPLATTWMRQNVRLSITAASTDSPVLVVPGAAVSTGADGTTSVMVALTGGRQRRVPVAAGIDANGYVQVTPNNGASLNPGDLVVIGQ